MSRLIEMKANEIESMVDVIFGDISELQFKEFMANSYSEKSIIREDIWKLYDYIRMCRNHLRGRESL